MDDRLTYYDLLGLSRDATQDEIEKARKQHIKALHPDRHPESIRPVMDQQLKRINHAADVLTDPGERAEYDARLRGGSSSRQRQDYYEPEDIRDFYEYEASAEAEADGFFEESEAYVKSMAVPPRPQAIPAPVYERLVDPPRLVDKLAAYTAYGGLWLTVTGLFGLLGSIGFFLLIGWVVLIPAGAFLISSAWSRSRFSPVRLAGGFLAGYFAALGNFLFTGRKVFTPLSAMTAAGTDPVDSSIKSGLAALDQHKRAMAVIKTLWRGPATILLLSALTLTVVPAGSMVLLIVCLAAVVWCAGRAWVLWRVAGGSNVDTNARAQ